MIFHCSSYRLRHHLHNLCERSAFSPRPTTTTKKNKKSEVSLLCGSRLQLFVLNQFGFLIWVQLLIIHLSFWAGFCVWNKERIHSNMFRSKESKSLSFVARLYIIRASAEARYILSRIKEIS